MEVKLGYRYRYTFKRKWERPELERAHSGQIVRVLRPDVNAVVGETHKSITNKHYWFVVHDDGFINYVSEDELTPINL